jgi:hypothetical protein
LPKEKYKQFEQWSKQIGLPMSNLVALCAWAGAQTVIPALDPDARRALEMLREQEESEMYGEMAEMAHQASEEQERDWQEFFAWKKERDAQNSQG